MGLRHPVGVENVTHRKGSSFKVAAEDPNLISNNWLFFFLSLILVGAPCFALPRAGEGVATAPPEPWMRRRGVLR